MFLYEKNEDIKAGMYSVLGNKLFDLLNVEEVDKSLVEHRNGDMEIIKLYKTKETFKEIDDKPFAWVKFICPSTGSEYLIACEPKRVSAIDAAKATRPFDFNLEYSFDYRT